MRDIIINDPILNSTSAIGSNYWIGLQNISSIYQWDDDSPFDFASDISGGVDPWYPNEPNNAGGEDCGEMYGYGDDRCIRSKHRGR